MNCDLTINSEIVAILAMFCSKLKPGRVELSELNRIHCKPVNVWGGGGGVAKVPVMLLLLLLICWGRNVNCYWVP